MFEDANAVTYESPRGTEDRYVTVGFVADMFFAVVWTWRGKSIRLISARSARDGERKSYYAHYLERRQEGDR